MAATDPTSKISNLHFTDFADTTERIHAKGMDLLNDQAEVMSLYMVENVPNGTGSQRIYDEYDSETYASFKGEGVNARKKRVVKGYTKTMYVRRFAAEIDITFEARTFGKDQEIIRRLTSLATFVPQRMVLDLTHRYTFATATSYVDQDGEVVDTSMGDNLAMASAVHTLTASASTYSTIVTGNPQFSQGAFEIAKDLTNSQILSNFGERRVLTFDTIVTGNDSATIRQVRQLQNSMADVTGDNSGVVNVYKGMFRHVILERLATTATGAYDSTKAKYWFYVASKNVEAHLGIWEAPNLKMPSTGNNGEDIHNDDWTFGTRGSFGICWVSAKGVLVSTGLGS